MIASAIQKEEEIIEITGIGNIEGVKIYLIKIYPQLEALPFQIAINQTIAINSDSVSTDDEIALLPPFAGG